MATGNTPNRCKQRRGKDGEEGGGGVREESGGTMGEHRWKEKTFEIGQMRKMSVLMTPSDHIASHLCFSQEGKSVCGL